MFLYNSSRHFIIDKNRRKLLIKYVFSNKGYGCFPIQSFTFVTKISSFKRKHRNNGKKQNNRTFWYKISDNTGRNGMVQRVETRFSCK